MLPQAKNQRKTSPPATKSNAKMPSHFRSGIQRPAPANIQIIWSKEAKRHISYRRAKPILMNHILNGTEIALGDYQSGTLSAFRTSDCQAVLFSVGESPNCARLYTAAEFWAALIRQAIAEAQKRGKP